MSDETKILTPEEILLNQFETQEAKDFLMRENTNAFRHKAIKAIEQYHAQFTNRENKTAEEILK